MTPESPSAAESRVLRWFIVGFFSIALLVTATTWWRKSQACVSQCAASGQAGGSLVLAGAGRLGLSTDCSCRAAESAPPKR